VNIQKKASKYCKVKLKPGSSYILHSCLN